jgi:oligo-alginate lyase
LLNQQELATLRQQLAQPGWKRDLYQASREIVVTSTGRGVRANADLWLGRDIVIPKYGGHFHLFFCVEGDRLEIPTDQRFVPGPYKCPKCGKEYSGEKYEAALRRLVHGWLAEAALDLGLVSTLEEKPEYAAKAAEILLKYADKYPGPHTSTTKGGMVFQSLDEAMWVIPLAEAYDLIYPRLTAAERTKIEGFLRTVARGIQVCGTGGNWGSWHLSAVGVVGYAIGDKELIGWATERFKQQIGEQLGDDGLWPESVHTYHYFPLLAFMHFAEAAYHGGVDLYHWEAKPGKSLLAMFTAPLAYAYPDLRLPAINDGWFQAFVPADFYELAWYRTQDPHFAWVLENGYRSDMVPAGVVTVGAHVTRRDGLYAFLFGRDIPTQSTPPPAGSVNFPVLGICALRSPDGAMLTFHYGPFLGHGHRDKMSITLFARQKLWLADYGTPGYGSAITGWYQSTASHNVVLVDNQNQVPTKENQVKLWLGEADLEAAQSQTRAAYPGVTYTRTVVRIGDYFVLSDQLESEQEHQYDCYLHGEGDLALDGRLKPCASVEAPASWITGLKALPAAPAVSGRWADGKKGVAFWMAGLGVGEAASTEKAVSAAEARLQLLQGKCPAEAGSRQIPLLIARQQGKRAQFVTVLFPYAGKPDCAVALRGERLAISHDRVTDVLTIPPYGTRPTVLREGR